MIWLTVLLVVLLPAALVVGYRFGRDSNSAALSAASAVLEAAKGQAMLAEKVEACTKIINVQASALNGVVQEVSRLSAMAEQSPFWNSDRLGAVGGRQVGE